MAAPYVVPRVEIRRGAPHGGEAQALIAAAVAELSLRYDGEQDPEVDLEDLVPPRGDFLVARLDGEPVGCGGLRGLSPGVGEIKRMYVAPSVRRTGVGRLLLAALEEAARELGWTALRLETGLRQPEAIALYEVAGYGRIADYGHWAGEPLTVCMEKPLA
jgi:GNAT superfamily N-acetyltransferase